jgi:rare lipoprotein A
MRQVAPVALLLVVVAACTARTARREEPAARHRDGEVVKVLRGRATFYGDKFHGRRTASGERFSQRKMTAAHRSLPFGTMVRVTNMSNGKSVVVRINDRGPFGRDRRRVIDVSKSAARALGFIQSGWARVKIEVLR